MGKKAYIGVNNAARQVKKIYAGIEGVSRTVKKGYIGVNGVARQFWPNGEGLPSKSNNTLTLQAGRGYMDTTILGKYSLFGTGAESNVMTAMTTNYVDAFDEYFTNYKLTTEQTYKTSSGLKEGFTTVGNYALLGGRDFDSSNTSMSIKINAYNTSLSRTTPNELSVRRGYLAASAAGNYALFGGGRGSSSAGNVFSTVDAYDKNINRTTPTALSAARCHLAAITIDNYVLFGGGTKSTSSTGILYNTVDAYDKNLNRTTPTSLSESRMQLGAATVGNYALFAGGTNKSSSCSTVDAYDKNLNRTTPTDLSAARLALGASSTENYALFAGGGTGAALQSKTYTNIIDVYDQTLQRSNIEPLSSNKEGVGVITLGNYILFGGGYNGSGYSDIVEIYDI